MAMTDERERRSGHGRRRGAERGKAVDAAILAIEKQFGRGSIMKLGSAERQAVDFIPTGSIALDLALGVGGIPRGRITEIFGPESSGKTTLCQHVLAEAQRTGRRGRVHRRRARARPGLRPRLRRQRRRAPRSASRTPASRPSRSPRRSSAPAASTASSSTPWRPSCRAPRSKARWATRSSASRPG